MFHFFINNLTLTFFLTHYLMGDLLKPNEIFIYFNVYWNDFLHLKIPSLPPQLAAQTTISKFDLNN